MSFDIYGDDLRRGHCEVHPHVHEEYPCSLCIQESRGRKRHEDEYERYAAEQYQQYCEEMIRQMNDSPLKQLESRHA